MKGRGGDVGAQFGQKLWKSDQNQRKSFGVSSRFQVGILWFSAWNDVFIG